jgi:hypothetical protein
MLRNLRRGFARRKYVDVVCSSILLRVIAEHMLAYIGQIYVARLLVAGF